MAKRADFALEFQARPEYLVLVRSFINCFARQLNLDSENALQLEICLDEACANSVEATQRKGAEIADPLVRIEINLNKKGVEVIVVDDGHDFTHKFQKAVPLTDMSDRTKRRGYGLQIIKSLMDEVSYVHDPEMGNRLSLIKYFRS